VEEKEVRDPERIEGVSEEKGGRRRTDAGGGNGWRGGRPLASERPGEAIALAPCEH